MIFYQFNSSKPMPLRTKIGIFFGIFLGLAILAIFAFTFFLIALAGGLALFVFNLFRPKQPSTTFGFQNQHKTQPYKKKSDNDIIDI
jgi:hypothetical protein|tara:strand:+ start:501 stop:761 length:261 start_codon:yes stop_codon:yes gene_type:complete